MHQQGIPSIDLFIEQDTERTPEPRKFYVIHKDQILSGYNTLKTAIKKYEEVKKAIGYVPPSSSPAEGRDLSNAIAEDLISRTELYWSNSSSFRTTNKVRR